MELLNKLIDKAWRSVLSSPEMYRRGLERGSGAAWSGVEGFQRVLILGVGGSGMVGDIVSSLRQPESALKVQDVKDVKTPPWTGPDTLAVAVSYSGNTAETLQAAVDALSKGATVVGVSSGGRLTSFLHSKGLKVVEVSEGLEPRYAVPEMVGVVYGILSAFRDFSREVFMDAVDDLEDFLSLFRDFGDNYAMQIASTLLDKTVVVLSSELLKPAAHRLKTQLNENAKHPAYTAFLPEACHNEVETWSDTDGFAYVMQRSIYEPAVYSDAFAWMKSFLSGGGAVCHDVFIESRTRASEVLKHVALSDMVSVCLAGLKKVDPFRLSIIPLLRPVLRKHLP
ncbi:MAG: SIS domain-containing protein [Candidatus Caldarchaeum sp.]